MIFSNFVRLEKVRTRLLYNSVVRPGFSNFSKFATMGILGGAFIYGDYLFFKRILIYFNALPINVGEILIIQLLNLLCLTFFSMLVFSNIIASISTLYMSRDLDFLISSPIPIEDIFLSKFIMTGINSSWMAILFGTPIFVAYGEVFHASRDYYLLLPVIMLPFLIIPSAIGVLTTMSLMRFFPARKTYQVMSFVGLVFVAGLVLYFRFLEPEKFLGKHISSDLIVEFVEKLKAPDYGWLPSAMMAKAIKFGAVDQWSLAITEIVLLWAIALVSSFIVIASARKIYYSGWSSSYGSRNTSMPTKERLFYRVIKALTASARHETKALVIKDLKLFFRDPGQWSQLFMLGALVVVYIFNIRNLPIDTFYVKNLVSILNIGLAGVVLAAVANRFVFASVSMEGSCFWIVKSAPVSFMRFLIAKFFLYTFPLVFLAESLVIISNIFLEVDYYVMIVSAVTIAMVTAGITGLGVGLGAVYPKFDFENVAEVATTTGAIIYMILSLAYIGFAVSLVSGPVYVYLRGLLFNTPTEDPSAVLSFSALFIVTLAFIIFPIRAGALALARDEG